MNASLERLSHRLWTQGREIRNLEIQICRLTTAPFVLIGRNNTEPPGTIFNYFTVGYILISWLKLREIVDKTVWMRDHTCPHARFLISGGIRRPQASGPRSQRDCLIVLGMNNNCHWSRFFGFLYLELVMANGQAQSCEMDSICGLVAWGRPQSYDMSEGFYYY